MVRPRRFALLLSAFLPLAAWAQDAQVAFGGLRQDTTLPVEVKAESLTVNQTDGSATFTGNVLVGQGEMRLAAQTVRVEYAADGKSIAKAGTPIHIDLSNLQTPAAAATAGSAANAVLLHDVEVTSGSHNGTALIFGFVNINRLASDVKAKVTAGINTVGAVSFIKA